MVRRGEDDDEEKEVVVEVLVIVAPWGAGNALGFASPGASAQNLG